MSSQLKSHVDTAVSVSSSTIPLPFAIVTTLAIVITVREGSLVVCQSLGYASAANIVGLIAVLFLLLVCRFTVGLPDWLSQASNRLLTDSGFAFLPISAGAGLLLFALGNDFWPIIIIMILCTLIPMWGLAKLADLWLGDRENAVNQDTPAKK